MFFQSGAFKALENGTAVTWQQQQLHLQNLANLETPGYKAKSMVFEGVLEDAQGGKVYQARTVTEENTSIRPDGNNVDADKEGVELYKAYAQYSMLLDKMKSEFTNYNAVINNGMK